MQIALSYRGFWGNGFERDDFPYVTRAMPFPGIDLRNLRHANVGIVHLLIILTILITFSQIVNDIY